MATVAPPAAARSRRPARPDPGVPGAAGPRPSSRTSALVAVSTTSQHPQGAPDDVGDALAHRPGEQLADSGHQLAEPATVHVLEGSTGPVVVPAGSIGYALDARIGLVLWSAAGTGFRVG